jgi:two-component system response regulator PilR (NtrC family)
MSLTQNCLVVDDEPDIRELLSLTLERMDIHCTAVEDLQEAREALKRQSFDLCLSDMKLPDGDGIELVEYTQQNFPHLPIAIITAHGSMESAITALKAGAFDFISKPVDLKNLRNIVNSALKRPTMIKAVSEDLPDLVGQSAAVNSLRARIDKLARSQAPVYISGESGTGKELVARLIHLKGPRADKPFIPVNCGAIPGELMESEFFGHKKGSFTGATDNKPGLFQSAQGGTLFLDEVADLPLHMQVKLLRAIQEKRVRPVGATKEVAVDVRILSATHKDLGLLVHEGLFRQDLFYRINVIELCVPPLRERPEDIPLLVDMILQRLIHSTDMGDMPELSHEAMKSLREYAFPGNVRELENILERAITLCEDQRIETYDLQLPRVSEPVTTAPVANTNKPGNGLDPMLNDIEKETILDALDKTRWNKTKAAKLLGINLGALRYRLQKLGLDKS